MKEAMNAWTQALQALEDFQRGCEERINEIAEQHRAVVAEVDRLQEELDKCLYAGDMDPVSSLEGELAEKRQLAEQISRRIPVLQNWRSHEVGQIAMLAMGIHGAGEAVMAEYQREHSAMMQKAESLRAEYLQTIKDLGDVHRAAAEIAWRVKLTHRDHLPEGNGPRRSVLPGVKPHSFVVPELDVLRSLGKIPEWTTLFQRNEQPLQNRQLVSHLTLSNTYRADRATTGFSPRPGFGKAPVKDEFQMAAERQASA